LWRRRRWWWWWWWWWYRLFRSMFLVIHFVIFLFFLQLWRCRWCSFEMSKSRQTQLPFQFVVSVSLSDWKVTSDLYQYIFQSR
jgi:hypothetical protein